MLKLENITRNYGDFTAVSEVSFNINNGEIVGLLGHNGAGKSTLMKLICGYLQADKGTITLDDIELTDSTRSQLQQNIGYLPENLPLYLDMPVLDYLDYVADLKGLSGDHKYSEIKRTVAATDISDKLTQKIDTLSRGYKQRVGVAQALLGNPKLLVLDEPTNGLDPNQTAQMRELIKAISKNSTVIISTHIMQEVKALCDRVVLITNGELQIDESLDSLQSNNIINITTSLTAAELQQNVEQLTDITAIDLLKTVADLHHYQLTIASSNNANEVCAKLAAAVVTAGANLVELTIVSKDLEFLFKQSQ